MAEDYCRLFPYQDLERQQGENARLVEDLARAQALATEAQNSLHKIQVHTETVLFTGSARFNQSYKS